MRPDEIRIGVQLFADFLKLELPKTYSDQYDRSEGLLQYIAVRSFMLRLRSSSSSDCQNGLDEETNKRVQRHGAMLSTEESIELEISFNQNIAIGRPHEAQCAGKILSVGKGK